MKFISFVKYKEYLESLGYSQEQLIDDFSFPLAFRVYYFSRPNDSERYAVNVYTTPNIGSCGYMLTDKIMSINYGSGSIYAGCIKNIKIDFRKKFWKKLICEN